MFIMKRVFQILSGLFGKNSSPPTPTPTPEIILITPDDIPVVTRPVVSRTIVYPPTPVEEKKMSSITPDLLLQFAPALGSDAGIVADILNASEVVGTPLRLAHFLAQAGHESILFSATTEKFELLCQRFGEYLAQSFTVQGVILRPDDICLTHWRTDCIANLKQ